MSATTGDSARRSPAPRAARALRRERADYRDALARIDRAQAETRKFAAEQSKLAAEALKLERDRGLAPWQVAGVVVAAFTALAASLVALARTYLGP